MEKEGYTISDIYQGGYSSLNPSYGELFIGYHAVAGEMGAPTKPDTANQIQQVNQLLNQGIIPIEMGVLKPEVFDTIPKQHFKEIKQMAELTGAKISVHAPLIEPSGITEQGWSETNRELAERQLNSVVEKAYEIDNKGGMPITIHSAGIPGREYKMTPEGKKTERLIVIDQETGKMSPMEEETKYYPQMGTLKPEVKEKIQRGEITRQEIFENKEKYYQQVPLSKGEVYSPERELDALNNTQWDNSLSQIVFYKEGADRILSENAIQIQHLMKEFGEGKITPEVLSKFPEMEKAWGHVKNAGTYLENAQQYLNGLFHKAYKYGSPREKKFLEQASEQFKKDLPKTFDPVQESKAIQGLIMNLDNVHPNLYVPIEDFAVEHSAKTFANVAFNAYDKFGSKAPTISIENLYPGMAFAYGKEMDNLITKSKEKFVEKAVEKGYSESVAKEQADRMIGMTFDLGHLNIAKKGGFKDKDLIKEAEEIAKHVKHVHLADNFGYSDSHLPPGMGNVPNKEILEMLEKKGFKGRKISEAGGFAQQFGISPFPYVLEAMGSPIYSMHMAPYWNQAVGLQQGYYSGIGAIFPDINYQTFGASFSQVPMELGGQRPGAGGARMSGKPME
jgi:hypothetical protein